MVDETFSQELELKKGMRLHPFLDGSGIVLYDPTRTFVSSLNVSKETFFSWLRSPDELNDKNAELLNTLIHQGFVVAVDNAQSEPL